MDVMATLHAELEEELGLSPGDVHSPRPLSWWSTPCRGRGGGCGSHVLDLGIAIETALDAAAPAGAPAAGGDEEYAALTLVPVAGLRGFLAREAATMNVQAPIFLARAGWL